MGSSRAHKEEKRGFFQRLMAPAETIKPPVKAPKEETTSHVLGQGTAQKAGAALRGRKSTIDSAIDEATK